MPNIYAYMGAVPKEGAAPHYVMLATPIGKQPVAAYARSLAATTDTLARFNIRFDMHLFEGGVHVDDARNYVIQAFLQSECTDLFFLDDDLGWQAKDFVRVLRAPGDIVGGTYPHKDDGNSFPFSPGLGERQANEHGLFEMPKIATGFMRIRREVLQALYDDEIAKGRYFWQSGDDAGSSSIPAARIVQRGFPDELGLEDYAEGNKYQSGDYILCLKARRLGFKCWLDPEMHFAHCGMKAWTGHFGNHLRDQQGIPYPAFTEGLAALREGKDGLETFAKLVEGRDAWPMSAAGLHAAYHRAREADGDVLECGSGFSTLVLGLALAGTERRVHSFEHDPIHWNRTAEMLQRHEIGNVDLHYAPLEPFEDGTAWYGVDGMDLPETFGLALIDGPPHAYGRHNVLDVLGDRLCDATLVIDDAMREKRLIASMEGHAAELVKCDKPFAIARPVADAKPGAVAAE